MTSHRNSRVLCSLLSLAAVVIVLCLVRSPYYAGEDTWSELFDGVSLGDWTATNFGGEGNVEVNAGRIVLEFGSDLTGITWKGAMPRVDYEVKLEGRREEGNDFFCGLTFPVNDSFCSLIIGGWGGTVVGLSNIEGLDASENETSRMMNFDSNRWYAIRLRVTAQRIQAWIDDRKVIDQDIAGRKLNIRPEVELSRPFGIASWRTRAALRKIAIRKINPRL
jgi:hypothetical protein